MRRGIGLMVSALGAFLIVLALLTRLYIAGQVVKFPLDEHTVSTLVASDVSYFSPAELQELTGVTMTDTSTTEGDVAAGSSSIAVWNSISDIFDQTDGLTYSRSLQRLAFNRLSGDLVSCCGANVDGKHPHFSGLGYVWPHGVQKATYQIFDATLMRTHPISYAGTGTVDGLGVYKFVEVVAPTRIGTQQLPGSLVGRPGQASVRMGEYYAGTTTDFVDPASGAPVSVRFDRHLYLASTSGRQVLNLLTATFATTPPSAAAAVRSARSYDAKIAVATVIVPATVGLAGIIVLIIGLIVARTHGESGDGELIPVGSSSAAPGHRDGDGVG